MYITSVFSLYVLFKPALFRAQKELIPQDLTRIGSSVERLVSYFHPLASCHPFSHLKSGNFLDRRRWALVDFELALTPPQSRPGGSLRFSGRRPPPCAGPFLRCHRACRQHALSSRTLFERPRSTGCLGNRDVHRGNAFV